MENYFVKGAWLSFTYRYNGRNYFGEVKKVKSTPKGELILFNTENGLRSFYTIGVERVCRHLNPAESKL